MPEANALVFSPLIPGKSQEGIGKFIVYGMNMSFEIKYFCRLDTLELHFKSYLAFQEMCMGLESSAF